MATIEQRFQAAVNVIKGLPKNGPYQPSTTMMLQFYGYYKQATEGPCHQKKPGFWDVVGKAKWDAWNGNRHLTKEQAMQKYVEELKSIIETMSFTENVQKFVGSLSGLDHINLDELEMIAPGMRELAVSHPNSPFNSRGNSPQHGQPAEKIRKIQLNGDIAAGLDNNDNQTTPPLTPQVLIAPTPIYANGASAIGNTNHLPLMSMHGTPSATTISTIDQSDDEYGDPIDLQHDISEALTRNTDLLTHNTELLKQVQLAVLRMNADMTAITQRTIALERAVQDIRTSVQKVAGKSAGARSAVARAHAKWWPFADISPLWFTLLILWPFIVRRLARLLQNRAAARR